MRHMLFMHGAMGGGLAGFFLFRMVRRLMMTVLIIALIAGIGLLWLRLQRERSRNRMPGWD